MSESYMCKCICGYLALPLPPFQNSQKGISQNTTKEDPMGRQGVESLRQRRRPPPPPPPLNPLAIKTVILECSF